MEQQTILLAGATGYLGSHLARRLLAQPDARVVALKRSTSDTSRLAESLPRIRCYDLDRTDLSAVFSDQPIDTVVNCVADYGRGGGGPSRVVAANLTFPLQLLEAAGAAGVQRFINAGTSLPPRVNAYALAKNQFAQWLSQQAGRMTCITLVMEHYFGPAEDSSKFIGFLVDSFQKRVPELNLTAGEQRRDFIYIDDVTDAFLTVISAGRDLRPGSYEFPLGSGQAYLLRDVVRTVQELAGGGQTRLNFGAVPYRPGEVMESSADIRHLARLGWHPRVTLHEGLRRTIELDERMRRVA